jgi:DNA replication initiation complex subunit (GINS family)
VELIDETISTNEWTQIHFKERINPAGPPGPLPDNFYRKAYQSFTSARDVDESTNIMNRMRARYRDILASRINRITRQAAAHANSPTRVLQESEFALYEKVHRIISEWRNSMLEIGEE